MWKCVMCETNNPVHCEECFICGTKKSDSLRISEDIKKREAYEKAMSEKTAAEKTPTDTPDASTSGIFGAASHDPVYEETKTPDIDPEPEYPSSVSADDPAEKGETPKTKRDIRLEEKELNKDAKLVSPKISTVGKILHGIILIIRFFVSIAFLILIFVVILLCLFFIDNSKDSEAAYSPCSMTEFMP